MPSVRTVLPVGAMPRNCPCCVPSSHELYHHPIFVGGDVLYRIAKVGKCAPQPGKSLFGSFHASRKAERRVAVNRIRRKQFVKYVELPGVQHLVVEPLYTALQLCAHDATAAPIALRSIATTSSERLTDPIILPWRRSFSAYRD